MEDSILVSVIIPSYNHDKYIEQAIRSVWDQSYKNLELIVIDDGSKDNSWNIIEKLAEVTPVNMITECQENQGLCKTLNKGIRTSSGELIALLASDDYYHPDFINRNVEEYLKHRGDIVVLHSDAFTVYEGSGKIAGKTGMEYSTKKPVTGKNGFWKMLSGKYKFISPTFVVPKYVYNKVGLYDETMVAEDFDMHLRQARVAEFIYINQSLFFKRDVIDSLGTKTERWANDIFKAIEKHRDYIPIHKYNKILISKCLKLFKASIYQFDYSSGHKYLFLALDKEDSLERKLHTFLRFMGAFMIQISKGILKLLLPNKVLVQIKNIRP